MHRYFSNFTNLEVEYQNVKQQSTFQMWQWQGKLVLKCVCLKLHFVSEPCHVSITGCEIQNWSLEWTRWLNINTEEFENFWKTPPLHTHMLKTISLSSAVVNKGHHRRLQSIGFRSPLLSSRMSHKIFHIKASLCFHSPLHSFLLQCLSHGKIMLFTCIFSFVGI